MSEPREVGKRELMFKVQKIRDETRHKVEDASTAELCVYSTVFGITRVSLWPPETSRLRSKLIVIRSKCKIWEVPYSNVFATLLFFH